MKNKLLKIICLLMAALIFTTCLTGCTSASQDLLQGFVQEWINTKFGIDTTSTNPIIKAWEWGELIALVSGNGTGKGVDQAALGTGKMIYNYAQAESLMQQGLANRDETLIAQAIALRPGDWSYKLSLSMMATENGQDVTSTMYGTEAEDQLNDDENVSENLRYDTQVINEYGSFVAGSQFASTYDYTKMQIYWDLSNAYKDRYYITQNSEDNNYGNAYYDKYKALGGTK